MRVLRILAVTSLILLPACTTIPVAVSNHTLQVGQGQETDVVWFVKGRQVYRCFTDQQGPVCMEARGIR